MSGKLYVVATPIGNLGDISKRALDVLSCVDAIASEKIQSTKRLLSYFHIDKKCISYHNYNERNRAIYLLNMLVEGRSLALVSEAGTPCISDPGYRIVNLAKKSGIEVIAIPGPSALSASLSICGLPTDHFFFEGFLPKKKGRKTRFKFLLNLDVSIIIYESPIRILKTLNDLSNYMGSNRVVSLCREMTKKFEEVFIGDLDSAIDYFGNKKIKGEFVIVLAKNGYSIE